MFHPLEVTYRTARDTVQVELRGDLDHHHSDVLLKAATELLAELGTVDEPGAVNEVVLDCAGLIAIDSSGLSTLLMIRRLTDAAHVRLRLVERPLRLERMLDLTGTLAHLTAPQAMGHSGSHPADRPSAATEESVPARSHLPDTTH
ncbi:STAS domain-containing protein [Streptomyces sp. NPDC101733]|uniref:STAS domain-containing protein n=1 Tax=unclassified Streptomyces TaxID=2593676 RepID=UPI0037FCEFDA